MSDQKQAMSPEFSEFASAWAESLSAVLGKITGQSFPCAMKPDAYSAADTDVHIGAITAGGVRGEMELRLSRTAALGLAQTFMGESLDETKSFEGPYHEATEELFRQIAGDTVLRLKARWGDVQMTVQLGSAPSWPAAERVLLEAGSSPVIALELNVSAALASALRSQQTGSAAALPAPPTGLAGLMDIRVAAKLRFGTRHMLLREILELSPGSIVELDRRVQEPVDLLLDGKLAARGEVVIVDGNYGIRITDVVLNS